MDDWSEYQFHGKSHFAAVYHDAGGAGHKRVVDHAQKIVEVNPPLLSSTLAEVNDHKALIRAGNVPADERVRGIDCWDSLEIDIGAAELGGCLLYTSDAADEP